MTANPTDAYDYIREFVSPNISRAEVARIIDLVAAVGEIDRDRLVEKLAIKKQDLLND